ncbi:MAG: hypothetical protein ALECFALPRED_005526 [Alectoria fallacina]|uniref:Symplekin/Pta1 N-terminal domain-containing protein n=1 Tax=Alectoria fallacina TaxID=1903189 RepID=A0A8H3IAQ7_9LECA|nr:MAG: hypothetical protein ALECFALPRED_005526 [Alectoria fallacina]
MALSVPDQLAQLEAARQIVLADAGLYPQIVQGILPIVGANARLELRRWGAEFLAETFASPTFALYQKENSAVGVLQILKDLLEKPGEDVAVVKSVVQTAASIYSLVFRYIIANPHDVPVWNQMASIKSNILQRWDTAATGVRICCIKFVQKVVQVQTPGVIADPRRPDQNDVSIALVPRDHPLIPPPRLEPEASGLLDRLLNVFNEDVSDAVLVNATLNCLGTLLRTRQSTANKIISAILNFNPMKQVNSPMTAKVRVQIKSMERTTRALLMNVLRRNETGPFADRIKAYVDRLARIRLDVFDEGSRKRGLPHEPTDGLDNNKRRRLGAGLPERPEPEPLPPGPVSLGQLFTLTKDPALATFDVTSLTLDIMVRIIPPVLIRIDQQALDQALNHVRARYLSLTKPPPQVLGDDEEDYEPDFEPSEDREQIINKADALPPEDSLQSPSEVALGPFKLPQPPPFTAEDTIQIGRGTISRVFSMMNVLEEAPSAKKQRSGLNRLAGSNYDKEAWTTVITRLATRASAGLHDDGIEDEDSKKVVRKQVAVSSLSDGIRETLWKFIIEDFRSRIPVAIAWLNEEWYNDRIQKQSSEKQKDGMTLSKPMQHYEKWMLKVLDGIVPYLDAKDKHLIRFLSEIPEVNANVLSRVKGLARDPERVQLAVNSLLYLILMKPPARDIAIDALEDLWRNYDDAKAPTAKHLAKWRPEVLASESKPRQVSAPNGKEHPEDSKPTLSSAPSPVVKSEGEQMKNNQAGQAVAAAG